MENKNKILLMVAFIYIASVITSVVFVSQLQGMSSAVQTSASAPASINYIYIIYLICAFIGTMIFIRLSKTTFKKLMEIYIILQIVLAALFLTYLYGSLVFLPEALNILLVLVTIITLTLYLKFKYRFFNLFGILLSLFINTVVGIQLSILTCAIILIVVSVWDYIAVIKSATMINMVRFYVGDGNPLPVLLSTGDPRELTKRIDNPSLAPKVKEYAIGLGDCVIPALFMVAMITAGFYLAAAASVIGAMIGARVNLWLVDKYKRPIPAIPAIALFELALGGIFLIL